MYEYLFFNEGLRDEFVTALRALDITPHQGESAMGLEVAVSDDIDDALAERIDELYDALLLRQAEVLELGEDRLERDVAGVNLTLGDGTPCTIRLDSDLVARMLTVMDLRELGALVESIAAQVESPDNRPLCHP